MTSSPERGTSVVCDDCGCDDLNCRCDEFFPEDLDCTHCGGDGDMENDDPIENGPAPFLPCFACRGTGRRKDQWFF